eukprot:TRINITY_DN7015_c0_g1_i2.p2 TRINITY_DN7015_c0_g1~~TRINITY_DN7015_c0_g1_i2.p2  ORF type:complete len:245 (+),score=25.27 TRINITY_DN7015_c0_g1_i2:72-806(+)
MPGWCLLATGGGTPCSPHVLTERRDENSCEPQIALSHCRDPDPAQGPGDLAAAQRLHREEQEARERLEAQWQDVRARTRAACYHIRQAALAAAGAAEQLSCREGAQQQRADETLCKLLVPLTEGQGVGPPDCAYAELRAALQGWRGGSEEAATVAVCIDKALRDERIRRARRIVELASCGGGGAAAASVAATPPPMPPRCDAWQRSARLSPTRSDTAATRSALVACVEARLQYKRGAPLVHLER